MFLSVDDRKLFFKNWLQLLTYVNDKYSIIDNFGTPKSPVGINTDDLLKIREKLWDNNFVINEYLEKAKLEDEEKNIVSSWNKFIYAKFLFIRSLKKYSVFVDFGEKKLYGVYGISSPIIDLVPYIPVMVKTVLIPFKDKIIFDSLIGIDNVSFGGNMRRSFNEDYMEIKKENGIITTLE